MMTIPGCPPYNGITQTLVSRPYTEQEAQEANNQLTEEYKHIARERAWARLSLTPTQSPLRV